VGRIRGRVVRFGGAGLPSWWFAPRRIDGFRCRFWGASKIRRTPCRLWKLKNDYGTRRLAMAFRVVVL
jgi:hypothetical protein